MFDLWQVLLMNLLEVLGWTYFIAIMKYNLSNQNLLEKSFTSPLKEARKHFEKEYINLRTTYLVDRKNTKLSQRNLYITGGISNESRDNFHYGIHGDWETRRIFTSFAYINKHTQTKDYSENEFQLGVAPYIGDYNDLHTWLMLKTKKDTINNNWETYPFIKLFKGDFLIEIGTKNSHWDVHYMVRF